MPLLCLCFIPFKCKGLSKKITQTLPGLSATASGPADTFLRQTMHNHKVSIPECQHGGGMMGRQTRTSTACENERMRASVKQTADSERPGRMASSGCWRPTRSCGRCALRSAPMASRCTTQPIGRPASRCRRVALSASTPACAVQRSVVCIAWQKQACAAVQAGRLSASPTPFALQCRGR